MLVKWHLFGPYSFVQTHTLQLRARWQAPTRRFCVCPGLAWRLPQGARIGLESELASPSGRKRKNFQWMLILLKVKARVTPFLRRGILWKTVYQDSLGMVQDGEMTKIQSPPLKSQLRVGRDNTAPWLKQVVLGTSFIFSCWSLSLPVLSL